MKSYCNCDRPVAAAPSAVQLAQAVVVEWTLDGVVQTELGTVVGLADSPPSIGDGWWYLVEIVEGIQPGTRDWFQLDQILLT